METISEFTSMDFNEVAGFVKMRTDKLEKTRPDRSYAILFQINKNERGKYYLRGIICDTKEIKRFQTFTKSLAKKK